MMIVTTGGINSRISDRGEDHLGRWTWFKVEGRRNKNIIVINMYVHSVATFPSKHRPANLCNATMESQSQYQSQNASTKKGMARLIQIH